jgi:hypothetical protein
MTTFAVLYTSLNNVDTTTKVDVVIRELSNKFSASLIGIFFSIFYSIKIKFRQHLENSREVWKSEDPRKFLYELYIQQQNTNKEIQGIKTHLGKEAEFMRFGMDSLVRVNNNIHGNMKSLEDYFSRNISSLAESLESYLKISLDKINQDSSTLLIKLIEENSKNFTEKVNETMELHRKNAEDSLIQMRGVFEELNRTIQGLTIEIKARFEEIVKQSEEQTNIIKVDFSNSKDELVTTYKSQADKLELVFSDLGEALREFNDRIIQTGDTMANNGSDRITEILDRFKDIELRHLTFLETVTSSFSSAVDKYELLIKDQSALLEGMTEQNGIIVKINETNQELVEALQSNVDLVKKINDEIAVLFSVVDYLQSAKHSIDNNKS